MSTDELPEIKPRTLTRVQVKTQMNKEPGNRHFRRQAEAEARRQKKYVLKTIMYRLDDPEVRRKYNLTEEDAQRLKVQFAGGKWQPEQGEQAVQITSEASDLFNGKL